MRFIDKTYLADEISQWEMQHSMSELPSFDGEDGEKDYPNNLRSSLRQILIRQQYGLCAYCESRVSNDNSHIEHVEPRHPSDGSIPFCNDWLSDNMVCSCNSEEERVKKFQHCGFRKENSPLPFTPLGKRCERSFTYSADGGIVPRKAEDSEAESVIKILNLNCSSLRNKRKAAIMSFFLLWPGRFLARDHSEGNLSDDLSDSDYNKYLEGMLKVDKNGELIPYWSAVKNVCGNNVCGNVE